MIDVDPVNSVARSVVADTMYIALDMWMFGFL